MGLSATDRIMIDVCRFIELIEEGCASPEENEAVLVVQLDRLALLRHDVDTSDDPYTYGEAPQKTDEELRDLIGKRFPGMGWYNVPEQMTQDVAQTGLMVGDAIDDLLDITKELHELVWQHRNAREADISGMFKAGFDAHWGSHLRWLQIYLHVRREEAQK